MHHLEMHIASSCKGNPGPGGYGVILEFKGQSKELSEGFKLTTNNRMEMMGAIAGLKTIKRPCEVTIYSNSKYLVDAITLGWAAKWQANNWKRNKKDKATNTDLWEQLLDLCDSHTVTLKWVEEQNKRCVQLAKSSAEKDTVKKDEGYK